MWDKTAVIALLTEQKIPYEVSEHKAVFNMAELHEVALLYPEWDAKNLLVRDDKKRHWYLITVCGSRRVDLKAFRKVHGLRSLSFASAEEMQTMLRLTPGSVTPFGLLNDTERRVYFFLDDAFRGEKIGVHPNDNTATVWLQAEDLVKLLASQGIATEWTSL